MTRTPRYPLAACLGLAVALIGLRGVSYAQPAAPTIACLRGDTLTWLDPTDACGPLSGLRVEAAPDAASAFEPVTTVAPGVESYVLTVAEGDRYTAFRVVGVYACTPAESAPSEVITSDALGLPALTAIGYDLDGTTLTWTFPPGDPRVTGVIVYKETSFGTTPLDTIYGATSYRDELTRVEAEPAVYYLGSIDDCDRTSFDATQYSSARLAAARDGCAGELRIARLLAAPWPRAFEQTTVLRRTFRGAVDSLVLARGDSALVLDDLANDTAYTVRVRYRDAAGVTVTTFPVDLGPEAVVRTDTIQIAQVSYEGGVWILRWRWNPAAGYAATRYRIRGAGGEVIAEEPVDDLAGVEPAPLVELGVGADFDWRGASVEVEGTDLCGVRRASAPARPGLLSPAVDGPFAVAVAWDLPEFGAGGRATEWTLRFLAPVGSSALLTSDTATRFVHDVTDVNQREVCYQLVTQAELPAASGRDAARFTWRSAPTCALRPPRVFLPTGFAPEGYTIGYRPKVSLLEGLAYRLRVFDRWGKVLFETDDPFASWDGRGGGGAFAAAGAYLAVVELEEPGRDPIRVEEMFVLVR